MVQLRARWAWLPTGLTPWVELDLDDRGCVRATRGLAPGASVDHSLLLPGLINAHLHLELSDQAGRVPAATSGEPMVRWVERSLALRGPPNWAAMEQAAAQMHRTGTRGCIDISNGTETASVLSRSGLQGIVLREHLGWDPPTADLDPGQPLNPTPGFAHRATAHAPISCSPAVLSRGLALGDLPCTIHCDESAEDSLLLAQGEGPWAELLDRLGRPWRPAWRRAASGVALLDDLGLLSPRLGLVHLVHALDHDLDRVVRCRSPVILCPRSNLHISRRLPNLPGMLARGISIAIGTDSLASTPDMDLLAEASVLAEHFPQVRPAVWVRALCEGGAELLARPDLGSLAVGSSPGVLSVDIPDDPDPLSRLLDGTRWAREWAA